MTTDTATSAEIMAAIAHGKQIIADWKSDILTTEAQKQADRLASIAEAWRPVLATIQQATPSWVHPYIVTPDEKPKFMDGYLDTYLRPATINLSTLITDIPPIQVWATPHSQTPSILFEAGGYFLVHDDNTNRWNVTIKFDEDKVIPQNLDHFTPDSDDANVYFHVALAEASDNISGLTELQVEAYRRNSLIHLKQAKPIEASISIPPAPIDPLERIAIALERIATSLEVTQPF